MTRLAAVAFTAACHSRCPILIYSFQSSLLPLQFSWSCLSLYLSIKIGTKRLCKPVYFCSQVEQFWMGLSGILLLFAAEQGPAICDASAFVLTQKCWRSIHFIYGWTRSITLTLHHPIWLLRCAQPVSTEFFSPFVSLPRPELWVAHSQLWIC